MRQHGEAQETQQETQQAFFISTDASQRACGLPNVPLLNSMGLIENARQASTTVLYVLHTYLKF
jgi:hypothetical protein